MTNEEQKMEAAMQRKRIVRTQDYHQTFTSEHGNRVLLDMMNRHYVLSSCFSSDALEMARREGERNVILRIMQSLKADPEQLAKLIREADDHAKQL
jgi:DNA-binding GntR family transcriptional regulator